MTSVKESKRDLKVLAIDGYLPTTKNMREGRYPFYAPLALVTKGEAKGDVIKFIDYLRKSPKVAKAMKKDGMSQTE